MILLYTLAAIAGLIAYAATARFGATERAVIALLVFLIPSVGVTILVVINGDRAPPDAVNVEFGDQPAQESGQLTDDDIAAYASKVPQTSFRQSMTDQKGTLGTHNGANAVADFPCSDDCPNNTLGIVHYDVALGDACKRAGGVVRLEWVPAAIAIIPEAVLRAQSAC